MKKICLILMLLGISTSLFARDEIIYVDLKKFINTEEFDEKLNKDVELYFGKYKNNDFKVIKEDFLVTKRTKKKGKVYFFETNLDNKKYKFEYPEKACGWALLGALKNMQKNAIKMGGNKIINIRGYYKNQLYTGKNKFQCAVGKVKVAVTLKGDIVKDKE